MRWIHRREWVYLSSWRRPSGDGGRRRWHGLPNNLIFIIWSIILPLYRYWYVRIIINIGMRRSKWRLPSCFHRLDIPSARSWFWFWLLLFNFFCRFYIPPRPFSPCHWPRCIFYLCYYWCRIYYRSWTKCNFSRRSSRGRWFVILLPWDYFIVGWRLIIILRRTLEWNQSIMRTIIIPRCFSFLR